MMKNEREAGDDVPEELVDKFRDEIRSSGRPDEPEPCGWCRGIGVFDDSRTICPKCGGYGYKNPLL